MGEVYPTTFLDGELNQHFNDEGENMKQSSVRAHLTAPKSAQSHSFLRTL